MYRSATQHASDLDFDHPRAPKVKSDGADGAPYMIPHVPIGV